MRFVVVGIGAVGGTVAGKLARSGQEVAAVARGAQLEAVSRHGLILETPLGDEPAAFPVFSTPQEIALRDDDCVLLCTKAQDTASTLTALKAAGAHRQPIVCAQNGVESERAALRLFPNVYGICVMLPCSYLQPGRVRCYSLPHPGILDVGRYPRGSDEIAGQVAAALERAQFSSRPDPDIMRSKYGKLLMNLSNAVQAAFGPQARNSRFSDAVRREGEAVLAAAGIEWLDTGFDSKRRRGLMGVHPVHGEPPPGNSSWQSLARGSGSIESDYLNGEIVLLGRLAGVPTPANEYFAELARTMVQTGAPPGSASQEDADACLFNSRR